MYGTIDSLGPRRNPATEAVDKIAGPVVFAIPLPTSNLGFITEWSKTAAWELARVYVNSIPPNCSCMSI
jgi:hypothetical protein